MNSRAGKRGVRSDALAHQRVEGPRGFVGAGGGRIGRMRNAHGRPVSNVTLEIGEGLVLVLGSH